ncbi:MAG: hypothetical protein AAF244_03860 [Pseudomonadota bacterium]
MFERLEKLARKSLLGSDWRISAENPVPFLDFDPEGMTLGEIDKKASIDIDYDKLPVKIDLGGGFLNITTPVPADNVTDSSVCIGVHKSILGQSLLIAAPR